MYTNLRHFTLFSALFWSEKHDNSTNERHHSSPPVCLLSTRSMHTMNRSQQQSVSLFNAQPGVLSQVIKQRIGHECHRRSTWAGRQAGSTHTYIIRRLGAHQGLLLLLNFPLFSTDEERSCWSHEGLSLSLLLFFHRHQGFLGIPRGVYT